MGKVSIGLRGWRFEETNVFTDDGEFKEWADIPDDDRRRLDRLPIVMQSPCQACWLIYGDAEIERCNVPSVVYGEPRAEVVLCSDHETDFLYWFHDEEGRSYQGSDDLQEEFHAWFLAGNRAPDGFAGVEHVDTDPENVPTPPEPDSEAVSIEQPEDPVELDLRDYGEVMSMDYPRKIDSDGQDE